MKDDGQSPRRYPRPWAESVAAVVVAAEVRATEPMSASQLLNLLAIKPF
jgi:hypothetical protein